ncbi:uncharacterized protein LOC133718098 [Rosa rugosa]|uniref:uncharacterized protein LOC133718098 n=1 Tax=Rosa rugosa TaxID=74645 RepID=UPI002B40E02F|nr:uncharacterized protein LOC133718098 [Rosa rugosa]
MSITLLDILTITGLPIDVEPYVHDQFDAVAFPSQMVQTSRAHHSHSYPQWRTHYCKECNATAFLEYWLCKFIFCTSSNKPTGPWASLATALYNGRSVGLGQPVLGALYRTLYQATMHLFEVNISRPFWILDFWIQVYFPHFHRLDIPKFPPADALLGQWLCRGERYISPPYSEYFSYLYLLDEIPDSDLVLNRRFPPPLEHGFLPRDPDYSNCGSLAFCRAISCSDIRLAADDISYELYAPNHFARQLGLAQLVPFPLYDAWNYNTSWRRVGPATGPPLAQSMLSLINLPNWADELIPFDGVAEGYDHWWSQVSVNC